MKGTELRAAIEAIPAHAIGGYEWECYSCHYHSTKYAGTECWTCKRLIEPTDNGHFWEDGRPASDHDELINRADVLALLDGK